jgi:hypothetical protein
LYEQKKLSYPAQENAYFGRFSRTAFSAARKCIMWRFGRTAIFAGAGMCAFG